jgi:ribosome biogenesis GTPase
MDVNYWNVGYPSHSMPGRRKKPRENDLAERYRAGDFDKEQLYEQDEDQSQRFSSRNKNAQQDKIEKTAVLRAALLAAVDAANPQDAESLPIGQVMQVYSLFCDIESGGQSYLCVTRKTLNKLADTQMVVGDLVRFRDTGITNETGRRQGVIEAVLPRKTVLTRTDSFKSHEQHPIVANAEQMLIVASVKEPAVKWGLVDRMIVAARSGGLVPIVCLNKIDLALLGDPSAQTADANDENVDPREALSHYVSIGVRTLETSVDRDIGLAELKDSLMNRTTVLAGHSGVGKSSLIRSIQPQLQLRIGEISGFTGKGRHTTTSARRYPLDFGGAVIDTPGVKMFGLWNMTRESLLEFFPDVTDKTAPPWRVASYERIAESLA